MKEIKELNDQVKCTVRPSSVHGVGVFAIRDIKKGEKLYCQGNPNTRWYAIPYDLFDQLHPDVRELIEQRWPKVKEGSLFQSPNDDARLQSFMNHGGEDSNYLNDIALRDIAKGDEVLEDYRKL